MRTPKEDLVFLEGMVGMKKGLVVICLITAFFYSNYAFTGSRLLNDDEIEKVYTKETNNSIPESKDPITTIFKGKDAPVGFPSDTDDFTIGAELIGFINLGKEPTGINTANLIMNFQATSSWTQIKDSEGKKLFVDAYTYHPQRDTKIPDDLTGEASILGDEHDVRLFFKVAGFKIRLDAVVTISDDPHTDTVEVEFYNTNNVKAPLVGTIIRERGLSFTLTFKNHENGWLVYGNSTVKVEKFEKKIEPEITKKIINNFFNWIKDKNVSPVY